MQNYILNDSGLEDSVWCQFSTLNNKMVLLECIYKSPNTTKLELPRLIGMHGFKFSSISDLNLRSILNEVR